MKFMSLFLGGMWGKEKDEKFNNFFLNFILVNFKKKNQTPPLLNNLGIDYV